MMISASTVLLASIIGPASAFVAPNVATERMSSSLRMSDPRGGGSGGREEKWVEIDPDSKTRKNGEQAMSKSLPFLKWPSHLDGTMPGDAGFDPLGLGKKGGDLTVYRESEIKHARLAMLAAAGWPISELFDKKIATLFGATPVLDSAGRVPSVLNGGMDKISPLYWVGCLALAAGIDLYGLNRAAKTKGYVSGDLGFDPFGLNPKDEKGKQWMQTAEIKNGRLAMFAITAFAAQEFVSHIAVVDQTPFFFKPIWEVLSAGQNSGYIIPPVETAPIVDAVTSAVDAVSGASVEATTVIPPVADAVSAAVQAAPAVIPPVDVVPSTAAAIEAKIATSPPVAVSPPVDNGELLAAKQRIAELEAKLAEIGTLTIPRSPHI